MAKLSEQAIEKLKKMLDDCKQLWILAAYEQKHSLSRAVSLEGTLGLLDWRLHQQISSLVKRDLLKKGKIALIPSQRQLGKASLLIFSISSKEADLQQVYDCLKKLQIKELLLAESTWPQEISTKLKKYFSKNGIDWNSLEGGSYE